MASIHQTSDVQTSKIGEGSYVWQFCVILPEASIGQNCNINSHVFIENDVIIGDSVTVKSGVQIWDGVRLGDNVLIGPNVTFTNDLVPRSKQYPKSFEKTIIQYGASIGANSTIIAGVTIGSFAFVGAGSVVTKSIPAHHVYFGNPAKHRGYVTEDGKLLDFEGFCKDGNQYDIIKYK